MSRATTSSEFPSSSAKQAATPLAVSRREAAVMLGISERLLWTWTQAGTIPHVRIGTRVLYPVEQLRQWLSKQATSVRPATDQ
jgi:excisionase family DNA binding protein